MHDKTSSINILVCHFSADFFICLVIKHTTQGTLNDNLKYTVAMKGNVTSTAVFNS